MHRSAIREATVILLGLAVVWAVLLFVFPWGSVIAAVCFGYTIYFFRDPDRRPPDDARVVVSAADGRVVEVEELPETEFSTVPLRRVSVFLSVFDVHVNRAPVAGVVVETAERTGKFLDARSPRSSALNAARLWLLDTKYGRVAVRQISGAIARRIVPWSEVGDTLARGEKFGMIRFGSRTDVYLPIDAEVLVRVGARVRAGETAIARMKEAV